MEGGRKMQEKCGRHVGQGFAAFGQTENHVTLVHWHPSLLLSDLPGLREVVLSEVYRIPLAHP
jgi:hypothetical protein